MKWKTYLMIVFLVILVGCKKKPTEPENRPPHIPSNPTPQNGAINQSITVDLSWTGGDPDGDSVFYALYFDTSSSPPLVESNLTITNYDLDTLSSNTTYYWKIVAKDEHGLQTEGEMWAFTTGNEINNPPNPPSNPSPSNGATEQSIDVDLGWACEDPDGDTLVYDIFFSTTSPPSLVANNHTSTSYDPGTLLYNTKYYWKIIAKDNHGEQSEGSIWEFTTWDTLPIPTGLSIAADAEGDGVIITWDEIININGYELIKPDNDTIFIVFNNPTYHDDAPLTTGLYTIYAIRGNERSSPATINSTPTTGANMTIYKYNPSSPTPSGFGWDPITGHGTAYQSIPANADYIDFYVDTSFTFRGPANGGGVYQGNKITYILFVGTSNYYLAPEGPGGYYDYENIWHGYYAFLTQELHYAKVFVFATTDTSVTFDYEFQTIQSLRIF